MSRRSKIIVGVMVAYTAYTLFSWYMITVVVSHGGLFMISSLPLFYPAHLLHEHLVSSGVFSLGSPRYDLLRYPLILVVGLMETAFLLVVAWLLERACYVRRLVRGDPR